MKQNLWWSVLPKVTPWTRCSISAPVTGPPRGEDCGGRGGAGERRGESTTSTLSWHGPAAESMAFGLRAKKKNVSEEMPKWIGAGAAKKHLVLSKCYLVDGSGWYRPTVGAVLCYSLREHSRWPELLMWAILNVQPNTFLEQISDSWVLKENFSYSIQPRVQRRCLSEEPWDISFCCPLG